jgi:hypothetical protein
MARRDQRGRAVVIEIIEGLPDNVVGLVAKGRVTKKDCADVLLPAIDKALEWHHRLRLYYEIRTRFPGAAWEEISLGVGHALLWERAAIVSDVAWIRHTVTALRLLIPSEVRLFATNQIPEGLAWITDAPALRRRRFVRPAAKLEGAPGPDRSFRPPPQYLDRTI